MRKKVVRHPHGSEAMGIWADIPGFPSYQASVLGEIRRVYQTYWVFITPQRRSQKKSGNSKFVELRNPEGRKKMRKVSQCVWYAFRGTYDGTKYCVTHISGNVNDNRLVNLELIKRSELDVSAMWRSRCIPVLKYDLEKREFIECYSSAKQAAEANYMSRATLVNRLNGKVKKAPALDGYEYCWDDEISQRFMFQRINGTTADADYKRRLKTKGGDLCVNAKRRGLRKKKNGRKM